MPILDAYGRPFPSAPPRPLDVPQVAGVSRPATQWGSVASTLSPQRLARVLQCAAQGDADAYLTLAEEMEERDLHYASVISTRKLAVSGEEIECVPGDESARGKRIARDVEETLLESDAFADLLFDLMDAVAKGYSVVQPYWETSETQWNYSRFEWIDPRYFQFDAETLHELRLKDPNLPDGRAILPGQFVCHKPKIKTGIPLRQGLARLAAGLYCIKSFNLGAWAAFVEVFGMPLRIARYDSETVTPTLLSQLRTALANIGTDSAALIPRGVDFDVLDARRPPVSGSNVFEGLANYADAQMSKAALGQTMTTDDGSSKAQAEVHDRVRLDIRRADAKALCTTIRQGIIAPWVLYNYGSNAAVPKIRIAVDPPEDLVQFTTALLPWVKDGGLKIDAAEVRERFGLQEPETDDILGGGGTGDDESRGVRQGMPAPEDATA